MKSNSRFVAGSAIVTDFWDNGGSFQNPVVSIVNSNSALSGLTVLADHIGPSNAPSVNGHEYLKYYSSYPRGNSRWVDNSDYNKVYRLISGSYVPSAVFPNRESFELSLDQDAYRRALSKLYSDIRGSDLNLATDLAESGEARHMVKNSVRDLIGYVKHLPSGKGLASAWLSYQYGWRPLIQSIYGVTTFARTNLLQREVRGSSSVTRRIDGPVPSFPWLLRSGYVKYSCKLGGRITVTNPPLYDLSRLSSLNPVSIAWELVPLSFVADWFYDIGGYMSDVETSLGLGYSFAFGYQTWTVQSLELFGGSFSRSELFGSNFATQTSSYMCSHRTTYKKRTSLASVPFPPSPKFKVDLGSNQLLSAAALIRQKFG